MPTIQDDRTEEQKQTHRILVIGSDRCLSGWGGAQGGKSYAAWACTPENAHHVERWVRARRDMERVRVTADPYRPGRGCAHLHIYLVGEGHPSLR